MRQYTKDDLDGLRFLGANKREYEITLDTDDWCSIDYGCFSSPISDVLFYLNEERCWVPTKQWVMKQIHKELVS